MQKGLRDELNWKGNVSFVLVEPKEPGNIGASARALKNMGFLNLLLVNPLRQKTFNEKAIREILDNSEARWFAAGAGDILAKAGLYRTLHEAISDKALVVGTTTRIGKRRGVILLLKDGIRRILEVASGSKVALLFGREESGLLNEEVRECGFLMTIPTSKKAPSLNLAQAVLLVSYELHVAGESFFSGKDSLEIPPLRLVSHNDMENLLKRIREALKVLGYIPRGDRDLEKKIMDNMGFLIKRAGLTEWELNMLHGIATRIIEQTAKPDRPVSGERVTTG